MHNDTSPTFMETYVFDKEQESHHLRQLLRRYYALLAAPLDVREAAQQERDELQRETEEVLGYVRRR